MVPWSFVYYDISGESRSAIIHNAPLCVSISFDQSEGKVFSGARVPEYHLRDPLNITSSAYVQSADREGDLTKWLKVVFVRSSADASATEYHGNRPFNHATMLLLWFSISGF